MKSAFRKTAAAHCVWLAFTLPSLSLAQAAFESPAVDFQGRVSAAAVLAGQVTTVTGRNFVPGQSVTLSSSGQALLAAPVQVNAQGGFDATVSIPAQAAPGLYPVVVQAVQPTAALVYDLKVSPDVPLSGQGQYQLTRQALVAGLYQVAYSAQSDSLFVTSAVGRPPITSSKLLKLNPQTLAIVAERDATAAPNRQDGHRMAVYGIATDDVKGTVWVTNTRDNTVAVYAQSDLSLLKQFDAGVAAHPRDVAVDGQAGKAYVSTLDDKLIVLDTQNHTVLAPLEIRSAQRGGKFGAYSLALDAQAHKLYTVSGDTSEVAVIDTRSNKVEKVIPVAGIKGGIGIAIAPKAQRLFVAAQGSDNVAVVDIASGKTLAVTPVGAGTLNVTFDPVQQRAYATNRGAGTVTVLDLDGKIIANLPGGTFPNHATVDGKGAVYVVNKARGTDDPEGDRITRIVPKKS